jgi:hypothetical protein
MSPLPLDIQVVTVGHCHSGLGMKLLRKKRIPQWLPD